MKEGWTYKKLGDCFVSINNGANIKQVKGASGIPITRIETLSNDVFNRDRMGYANIEDVSPYCSYVLNDGDILMSHINSMKFLGRAVEYNKEDDEVVIHGMNLLRLVPSDDILSSFAVYQFQTDFFRNQIKSISHQSVNQASFNITNLKGLDVLVPPMSVQQRIVERLDSAFENIDKLKANAEKQLSEARILFQKSLAKAMEPKEGWEEKTLKDVADFVRGPFGGSLTKSMFKSEGYAVYEQQHAIHGHINIRYYIDSEKFKEMERFSVEAGDLIMSCSGVTLGRVNLLPSNTPAGIINQALLKMKVIKNTDARYFKFWLESVHFQKIIKEYSGGAAIPNVPAVKILKDIKISIPSLAEQQRIVERLDSLSENVRKYEEIQRQIISECDALKQALLRKVFE